MANAFVTSYKRQTPLVVKGVKGHIKWAYYVAATVEGYTAVRSLKGVWTVRAKCVQADAFKLRQTPLAFVAQHAKGTWLWQVQDSGYENGVFRATLLGEPVAETNPQGGNIQGIRIERAGNGNQNAPARHGPARDFQRRLVTR